ncbi:ribosomal-protein-serine acetyltransferase [Lentibacillus kapialis]|uniref:Ribosomal-protein-serine acetyltransferase n=1 Tax=Lentibacillus kapialis TaxID=340214 RepID=A0A917PSH3_9BACI|nr:GNAT family N-acetyltransferase [Lentibacillus kapialis]GGJ89842.1 ribosomal-protein-serine acetyltransferase [Lentibacillus kapialis]
MFLFEIDEEIALKHLEITDAAPLFQLTDDSRETLRQWLSWVDHTKTPNDSRSFIESVLKQFAERRGLTTGILYQGELAGVAGFNLFDWTNGIGHIGYWLGAEYEGRGIMTRAVSGLIDYAFYSLELNRIEIRAAYANHKSRAIPERLGFVQEGRIRQAEWLYDHFADHAVYGKLAHEWKHHKR